MPYFTLFIKSTDDVPYFTIFINSTDDVPYFTLFINSTDDADQNTTILLLGRQLAIIFYVKIVDSGPFIDASVCRVSTTTVA